MVQGKSRIDKVSPYLYLAPALISITIFTVLPILYTFYLSFTNYNLYHMNGIKIVGFTNYVQLITGNLKQIFFPVLLWTIVFALVVTLGSYIIGLGLSLLLNNPMMKETRVYRAILIIPWALPATIACLTWQGLLNESYGGINNLLKLLHLPSNIPWITDPTWARVGIIIASLWLGFPYMMNVCLGALQTLSPEYFESAELDGATKFTIFRKITLPLISRSTLPLVISTFAFNFNNFNNIYMINAGDPPRPNTQFAGFTDILTSAGYNMTTKYFRYDLASAMSVLIFIIIGGITLFNMISSKAFKEVD